MKSVDPSGDVTRRNDREPALDIDRGTKMFRGQSVFPRNMKYRGERVLYTCLPHDWSRSRCGVQLFLLTHTVHFLHSPRSLTTECDLADAGIDYAIWQNTPRGCFSALLAHGLHSPWHVMWVYFHRYDIISLRDMIFFFFNL